MENNSSLRFYLSSVTHPCYSYVAVAVDVAKLESTVARAREALKAALDGESGWWGEITIRGMSHAVLISDEWDHPEWLTEAAEKCDDDSESAPVEITEAQFDELADGEDFVDRADCAGFEVSKDSVNWVGYPHHGEGHAESRADFEMIFSETPAA